MTTWRNWMPLFLFIFLGTIDVSKQHCTDYFTLEELMKNPSDIISLVQTKDPKDMTECTLENECREKRTLCHFLQCFDKYPEDIPKRKICDGPASHNVSYHHFMCLMAKAANLTAENLSHIGCEYDTVCRVYTGMASTVLDQTTTRPPQPTSTVSTTSLAEKTTAAPTVLSPTTTVSTTVLRTAIVTLNETNGQSDYVKLEKESSNLKIALLLSLLSNVALLASCLYVRHQKRVNKDAPFQNGNPVSGNEASLGAKAITETNTLLENVEVSLNAVVWMSTAVAEVARL